jgi:hypothetical protein
MKKFFFFLAAGSIISMAACKSGAGPAATPEAAVQMFFDKLKNADFDGAKKYATKESASFLEMMSSAMKMAKGMGGKESEDELAKMKNAKFEIGKAKINGDMATVSVTADGDAKDINVKKEDGSWKVAFDKSMLGGGDALKGLDIKGEEALEGLGSMKDSLGNVMEKLNGPEMKEAMEKLNTPEFKEAMEKMKDPAFQEQMKKAMEEMSKNPEAMKKMMEAAEKLKELKNN